MTKKAIFILLISLLAILTVAHAGKEQRRNNIVKTIIIDPGHGGPENPGAVGPTGFQEKLLTLQIAFKLRDKILTDPDLRASGVKVVLTRDRDMAVTLEERAAIANSSDGDLYISIHANGFHVSSARGAETYFLSLKASDAHAQRVAEIENQSFEESESELPSEDSEDLKMILFDFIHNQYINESKFLAEHIQDEFNASLGNGDRGIKQAPFRVLKGVAMPAVLVEVDFISNPDRERLLRSDTYQDTFAGSMLKAIKNYKQAKERGYSAITETSNETEEAENDAQ